MKIFTVTVNFNCAALLERHLACLSAQSQKTAAIVVDNASTDNSRRLIREKHPNIRLIESDKNLGYGAGANLGLKYAASKGADFVLVLNPDVFPEPDYIEKMCSHMQTNPQTAVCGGRLYREDQDGEKILDSTGLFLRWNFFGRDRDAGTADKGQNMETEKVFALCGAALFIRISALTDEFFDSNIFMYGEDIDICWRTRRMGLDVVYLPQARAIHIRGGTGAAHRFRNQTTQQKTQTLKSRYIYLFKNLRPGPWQLVCLLFAELEVAAIMFLNPKLFRVWADIWKMRRKLPAQRKNS